MRSNPSPVDEFFQTSFIGQLPEGFERFREASDRFEKTRISLGPLEAGILKTLACLHGGKKWVEIGTLTGFSAYCLASVLPSDARLWTLEKDPELAATARRLLEEVRLSEKVTVVQGDAAETLEIIRGEGPFDGLFIDGNKAAYFSYLHWAEQNLVPGGLIIADNVFLGGAVWDPQGQSRWNEDTVAKMRAFLERIFDPARYQTCLIPTGEGLAVARKRSNQTF